MSRAKARRAHGTGCAYQHGAAWWIKYRDLAGRTVRENVSKSKSCRTDVEARAVLQLRLDDREQGKQPARPCTTMLADLQEMLRSHYTVNGLDSWRHAAAGWKHLETILGGKPVARIEADDLDAYAARRIEQGAKPATVARELSLLKTAMRLALRAKRVPVVPVFPTLKISNARQGFFEPDQLAAVLRHLAPPIADVTRFGALTGWRKSEILGLQWRNVDFAAGVVVLEVGTTKNRDGRTFPFAASPELSALLRRRREETTTLERSQGRIIPWVFHRRGKPILEFGREWIRATKAASIPGRLFHDLRRSAVRNLERAGIARSVATKLTGHKSEVVYRRYAIVSESDLAEAVAKLSKTEIGHKLVTNDR